MEIFIPSAMICGTHKLLYMDLYMLGINDDRSQTLQPHTSFLQQQVVRQTRTLGLYLVYSASHDCMCAVEKTHIANMVPWRL